MAYDKYKINELIEQNYVFASVLFYFGIDFYEYSEETLEQVCRAHGLQPAQVIQRLETACQQTEVPNLNNLPINIILEYLKHTHYLFVKYKLPYLARLIKNLEAQGTADAGVVNDLKFVFPLFVEDFIKHIYQEEDTLFSYILQLHFCIQKEKYNPGKLFYLMEKHSIETFAIQHDGSDNEMKGIRSLTNDFQANSDTNLLLNVLYRELESFETALLTHAKVEDEILFPKAMLLEKDVKRMLRSKIVLN